jgi:hypothetical protein
MASQSVRDNLSFCTEVPIAKTILFCFILKCRVIQSIVTPKLEKKSSTISTLWNARDHIKFVQNKLGGLVGTLESFKVITR